MKFTWFNLMPWPYLPDDFREQNRSVWVDIPSRLYDPKKGHNPPIRVAEEFAMLDVISGGRLVAGFPVGTPMDTNFCYGQIPALTRDKYQEAHDMIMKAWAEDEHMLPYEQPGAFAGAVSRFLG
ncbi:MAG: hypothetical protein WEG40_01075 [Candidatus Rokuibacteriota bacterium]